MMTTPNCAPSFLTGFFHYLAMARFLPKLDLSLMRISATFLWIFVNKLSNGSTVMGGLFTLRCKVFMTIAWGLWMSYVKWRYPIESVSRVSSIYRCLGCVRYLTMWASRLCHPFGMLTFLL